MIEKHKKQYGVWMDSHHATVVGREHIDNGNFMVLAHIKNSGTHGNSNESSLHHEQIALMHKFFKEIASKMQNIDEIHVTGTGPAKEQFIHYLKETPQYKHAAASDSTNNKMTDEHLVEFFAKRYH
ncbi:MAG: hypothetical protein U0T73_04895 [Chitinophagales bacterium]